MGDENTNQKKRKSKWTISYSNVSMEDAEERLGFLFDTFESHAVPVSRMLAEAKYGIEGLRRDAILKTKETVYDQIVRCLDAEGYLTESNEDFKEANISDLVFAIIGPIISEFRRKMGCDMRLRREKEIIGVDSGTGGFEEFVVMDLIAVKNKKFVFIAEAKRSSIGEAKKQCLLTMKDMGENNGGGVVYGFVTTGERWQMIKYDGTSFTQTEKTDVLFYKMDEDKERWMRGYSVLVDCMNIALSNGGVVQKDAVFRG